MNFTLRGVGISQFAGMANVKVHDNFAVSRNVRNRGQHRLGCGGEGVIIGVSGKHMNTLALRVILGGEIWIFAG